MWKLAIVLCATAAIFASTKAQSSIPIPDIHHEEDVSTPKSELTAENTSWTSPMDLEEKRLDVVINRTMEMVKNRYIEVYRKIFNRGALDPKISMAIKSEYTTKLHVHLELIKSIVDDLISWGKENGSFDEDECRSFHSSYNDLMTEIIFNSIQSAPSQAFHEVSLQFVEMLVGVKENLKALSEKLHDPKMTVQKIHELSEIYYAEFNSRTDQLLIEYERLLNGTAIEEIVRRDWDMMISAVPDVVEITHECVTRSLRPDLSKVTIE